MFEVNAMKWCQLPALIGRCTGEKWFIFCQASIVFKLLLICQLYLPLWIKDALNDTNHIRLYCIYPVKSSLASDKEGLFMWYTDFISMSSQMTNAYFSTVIMQVLIQQYLLNSCKQMSMKTKKASQQCFSKHGRNFTWIRLTKYWSLTKIFNFCCTGGHLTW